MISPSSSRSGFALVIVLSIVVLLVALVMGFLLSAATERTAASSYKSSVVARELADTAVSLVQGQINVATTQGSSVSWASQPGMVRTFNSTGTLIDAYKLYSAPNMISTTLSLTADLPPANWASLPALWTDLNAPVQVSGTNNYPILDPSAAVYPNWFFYYLRAGGDNEPTGAHARAMALCSAKRHHRGAHSWFRQHGNGGRNGCQSHHRSHRLLD